MSLVLIKCINYIQRKQKKKGRTAEELNEVITWLTAYTTDELDNIDDTVDMETFFSNAPELNPNRSLIKGSICGAKIMEIEEEIMREIRYLDKLVDELAKGKKMDKILR